MVNQHTKCLCSRWFSSKLWSGHKDTQDWLLYLDYLLSQEKLKYSGAALVQAQNNRTSELQIAAEHNALGKN